jgi:hypothetical protein
VSAGISTHSALFERRVVDPTASDALMCSKKPTTRIPRREIFEDRQRSSRTEIFEDRQSTIFEEDLRGQSQCVSSSPAACFET